MLISICPRRRSQLVNEVMRVTLARRCTRCWTATIYKADRCQPSLACSPSTAGLHTDGVIIPNECEFFCAAWHCSPTPSISATGLIRSWISSNSDHPLRSANRERSWPVSWNGPVT